MTWRHLCLNSEGFLALKGTFVQTAALSLEKKSAGSKNSIHRITS